MKTLIFHYESFQGAILKGMIFTCGKTGKSMFHLHYGCS